MRRFYFFFYFFPIINGLILISSNKLNHDTIEWSVSPLLRWQCNIGEESNPTWVSWFSSRDERPACCVADMLVHGSFLLWTSEQKHIMEIFIKSLSLYNQTNNHSFHWLHTPTKPFISIIWMHHVLSISFSIIWLIFFIWYLVTFNFFLNVFYRNQTLIFSPKCLSN